MQDRRGASFVDGSEQRALFGELLGIDAGAQEPDQDEGARMHWYLDPGADLARFAPWLGTDSEPPDLSIVSDDACVAATTVPCIRCREPIEVTCIHCKSGTASGEPLTQFTVVDVLAVDDALARQLTPWPGFRPIAASDRYSSRYANYCLHCGAEQDDVALHTEPGDPFFDIPHAAPDSLRLTPLVGRVRLSGDEHFTIE